MDSLIIEAMSEYIKLLKDRAKGLELMLSAPPAQMSTPLGMLPVNSDGMRKLADALTEELSRPLPKNTVGD